MTDPRIEKTRAYIHQACDASGLSPSALARKAGIAPSTLNRFLNDDPPPSIPANATLQKIARASGLPPLGRYGDDASGFSEDQAAFLTDRLTDAPDRASLPDAVLTAIALTHPHTALWQMRGHALTLKGLLDGDYAVVDLNRAAAAGDIVVAQLYDWHQGTARTVFRLYAPPYLLGASGDPLMPKPELADDRAQIKGTVIFSFRTYDSPDVPLP